MKIHSSRWCWVSVFRQLARPALISEFQSTPSLVTKCGGPVRISVLSRKFFTGLTLESEVKVANSDAMARVLNVAEKNDAAKRIAELLAGGANNIHRVIKLLFPDVNEMQLYKNRLCTPKNSMFILFTYSGRGSQSLTKFMSLTTNLWEDRRRWQ